MTTDTLWHGEIQHDLHGRHLPRPRNKISVNGTDTVEMPHDPAVRRAAFTAFVGRALDRAQLTRDWSVTRVAEEAGIGANTVHRWRRGDWQTSPSADQVKAFCDALQIPPSAAFAILWPDDGARPAEPVPLSTEPDMETLLRRLADPEVPRDEKFLIRETVRSLALRQPRRDDQRAS